jgi:DNA-binding MarR family transcriptional regulator
VTVPAVSNDVLHVATELRACLGPLVRRLRRVRVEAELTLSQLAILSRLERDGPATPTTLAAQEQIRPQSVAALVGALEERGLVTRTQGAHDRRSVVVATTARGSAYVGGLQREKTRALARALATELTSAELDCLKSAIPLLARLGQAI